MKSLCITDVRARRLDIPMKKAFGIAGGAQELARNVLVEITLASGVRGWGEAAPLPAFNGDTQERALGAIANATPELAGADVRGFRQLGERIFDVAASGARGSPSAACALETAVFDALARANGTSLRGFFGGAEEELVTDITITTGTTDDATREAREFAAFGTLKIKVGGKADHDVELDVARVLAVHAARPDARLLLDANGGLSVRDAIHLASELRARGVVPVLFEQPVAAGDWEALAEVRSKTKLVIAIDESVTRADDVLAAHRAGAADAANVKLMKSGIGQALDIVAATRACGLQPMIGGMVEARLAMGTSACLAAGLGGFAFIDLDTPLFLSEDPFDGGYVQRGERLDLRPIDVGHGCVPRART
ncbi:MAG: L-alanine-DL-glutamate epimerase [Labilithrix sp.]|nr:L-alanine-DL-glutamate epimerase [Labilithrix sp.]